ncbi:MAG: fibronectin type III domain-containing protein [Lachnospiraceae bacterium]|nr:fibronectin type III domain-containing protein [Lachnospiraceae bacterium]
MRKGMIRRGAVLLSMAAGLILTTGTQAKAGTLVDPVVIDFPEDAHVAVGADLNDLLPCIKVNQTASRGVYTVAEIPQKDKTVADDSYDDFYVRKQKLGSSYDETVKLSENPVVEKDYEYSVQFYYRAMDGYSLSTSEDTSHALVNGEPINQLYKAGTGDAYRKAIIFLSPADWGSISYDLSGNSGYAKIANKPSGIVLQRTFRDLSRNSDNKISVNDSVANITKIDLDQDGTPDIQINLTDTSGQDVRFQKVSGASVTTGTYEFTIPASEMPYEGKGLCCNRSVYSKVTVKLGAIAIDNAKISAIAEQTYTGSPVTPAVTVTLDGKALTSGTDYEVAYSNNTNEGTATVTVTGKGAYKGTVTTTFVIKKSAQQQQGQQGQQQGQQGQQQQGQQQTGTTNPGTGTGDDTVEIDKIVLPKVTIKSCKAKAGKKIALKWKEVDEADGYEIAYSTDKKFKKSVKTKKSSKKSITLKSLKKGKVYYVRVRAYVKEDGKTITGKWSAAKRVKVKK